MIDTLAALRQRRDEGVAHWRGTGERWNLTEGELRLMREEGGEKDFPGVNLYGANLYGANLYRANLYGANLYWATLEGATLYGANLHRANLREANLEGATLEGANLYRANLYGANLYGANLEGADLEGADLYWATLYRANLREANLEGADLREANLEGADLREANLEGADLEGANLYGANLEGANLYRANLREANLINTRGIYSAFAPNLSSRRDALNAGVTIEDGKIELCFWAGCQQAVSADQLRVRVNETYGESDAVDANLRRVQYEAAITFIEACFAADMAAGKWDYLLGISAASSA